MTPAEFLEKIQSLAELIGPNLYLQALIIAVLFIIMGKIADWVISAIIGKFASRSSNDFDDQIVDLVHKPVFVSFVLLGLALASNRMQLPELPTTLTTGILKTIAIFIWYSTLSQFMTLLDRTSTLR